MPVAILSPGSFRPSRCPRGAWKLLVAFAFVLGAGCSREDRERSVLELPGVHYTPGFAWYERKMQGLPEGTGWVQVPPPVQQAPYFSGIDPFLKGFVQPAVCGECHREIHQSFLKTAHYRTAEEATEAVVLGSFAAGKNELETRNPDLRFTMLAGKTGLHQRLTIQRDGQIHSLEVPMDISTGSGNHGQTYLYWHGDELYELPVSYFTELDRWVNSPGMYTDGTADFSRGIGERCLDCHATYFAPAPNSFNRYDRTNYILGVTCVRCHGAGWAHVQYHRQHQDDHSARYIVHPAALSVERANEICAQCHSGAGRLLQPAFTYQPGEPLDQYVHLDFSGENPNNDDPHAANQLARLMKSRCFTESKNLTCFKCHNPHVHERGDLALHSKRCGQCHETGDCGLSTELGNGLATRCVACHMASRRDAEGIMETTEGAVLPLLRDHFIQARPEATKSIVDELHTELLKLRANE
jgi:hypothetical protein